MKKERELLNIIGDIDDDMIESAEPGKEKAKRNRIAWISILSTAALIALIFGIQFEFLFKPIKPDQAVPNTGTTINTTASSETAASTVTSVSKVTVNETSETETNDKDANEDVKLSDIAGLWVYQEVEYDRSQEISTKDLGIFNIYENGTYDYQGFDNTSSGGTITTGKADIDVDAIHTTFTFNDGTDVFLVCWYDDKNLDVLQIGNGGVRQISRVDTSKGAAYANNLFTCSPNGLTVADLTGTWVNADNNSEVLMITEGKDKYTCHFTYTDTIETVSGDIKFEITLTPDNMKKYMYSFCNENGDVWNSFEVRWVTVPDEIYSTMNPSQHYIRQSTQDQQN